VAPMSAGSRPIAAATLVPGQAAGEAFVLQEPLSFWGGLDSGSGRIIDRWHPQHGAVVAGRILVMKAGRGSSSGSSVLAEAIRRGTGPAGIVLLTRDPIVTVGAMVAQELYGRACPVILAETEDWPAIAASPHIALDARSDGAAIRCAPPGT
jgi:predicted aconitase with swiveling domain